MSDLDRLRRQVMSTQEAEAMATEIERLRGIEKAARDPNFSDEYIGSLFRSALQQKESGDEAE